MGGWCGLGGGALSRDGGWGWGVRGRGVDVGGRGVEVGGWGRGWWGVGGVGWEIGVGAVGGGLGQ